MERYGVRRFAWLIGAVALLPPAASSASDEDVAIRDTLTVDVRNVKSDRGRVGCAIFRKQKGFPTKQHLALRRTWASIEKGRATCVFNRIGLGEYAISAFHDSDVNGGKDLGFDLRNGGWGVSNNLPARSRGRPPRFKDAKFKYQGGKKNIEIRLVY